MQINPAPLHNQSRLIKDYRNQKAKLIDFFDYPPFGSYQERIEHIKQREFDRKNLMNVLLKMNKDWDAPQQTLQNIKRLEAEDSTVVIGGQQAGLLTGPLYTINKVISIIQLARQKEKEFEIPVIPVFWIAGEDHDFEEINHVYLPNCHRMQKHKLNTLWNNKRPVSELPFDRKLVHEWMEQLFQVLPETEYTEDLYEGLHSCINLSNSYTDFFARILLHLFKEEGLVLIDSANEDVRHLEQNYFITLIKKQPQISEGIHTSVRQLKNLGYELTLDAEKNDGHLFYHFHGDRILLIRNEEGNWVGKNGEVILSTEELIDTVKTKPQNLSNNVVTRPLMQELLFPTLAFVGGPGEIAYWAALKPAFHAIGIMMPPVIPRWSLTYIDRLTEKNAQKFDLTIEQLINEGVAEFRENWLQSKVTPPINELANDVKEKIEHAHQPLREMANEIRADISLLAEKNLQYLYREIEFLERKMNQAVEEKYVQELNMLHHLEMVLYPNGGLQERTWNPLPLINKYGSDWLKAILRTPLSLRDDHYIVYL